jgi:histidyl-tRNA synthetase
MHKSAAAKIIALETEATAENAYEAAERIAYRGPHRRAFDIAEFYGFRVHRPLGSERGSKLVSLKERVYFVKGYLENKFDSGPAPVMAAYLSETSSKDPVLKLQIIGIGKSVAEGILIHVANAILGTPGETLEINSIGDKESMQVFIRELTSYYKKNAAALHGPCRQALKTDPLKLLACSNEKCSKLREHAPNPLSFLSESSRQHFKEIVEFLEAAEVPYALNQTLTDPAGALKSIYEICRCGEIVAEGGRYDGLARKLGARRDVPAADIAIKLKRSKEEDTYSPLAKQAQASVFFIQLGFEAKLRSFGLLETLRAAKVPVRHALNRDDLVGQLTVAERLATPYTIILGQREVVDGTVIVRNMETRSQETLPVSDLMPYLTKIGVCKK